MTSRTKQSRPTVQHPAVFRHERKSNQDIFVISRQLSQRQARAQSRWQVGPADRVYSMQCSCLWAFDSSCHRCRPAAAQCRACAAPTLLMIEGVPLLPPFLRCVWISAQCRAGGGLERGVRSVSPNKSERFCAEKVRPADYLRVK